MSGGGGGIPGLSPLAKAVQGVASGVGKTVENIGRNPLPIILAVAITVATSGLGAGIAAAELAGFTAAEIAVAGSTGSMIAAATNAAIANAAIAAVNGGDISKIATSAIIGGITAGVANGIPASDVIKNVTEGLDTATRKIIESSAGQSVSGAVGSVLQGKDPFTGAFSGAISGALSSSLSSDQLADLNKEAAKIIGSTGAAAAVAGVTGKDISKAISNSAAYGIVKSGLASAYDEFIDFKNAYQETADKINPLIDQANELYKTAEEQKLAAQEKNADIDPQMEQAKAEYYAAKDAQDTAGMTAAAAKFNELNAVREENLKEFNQTNSQLAELKTQIDPLNELIVQQQAQLEDSNTKLVAKYGDFAPKVQELTEKQADINESVDRLPAYYEKIYNDAVARGEDGEKAIAEVRELYDVRKTKAEAEISDLPAEYKAAFQSQLLQGVDPGVAQRNVQDLLTRNTLEGFGAPEDSRNEADVVAKVEGTYQKNPNTGMWSVVGKDPEGNEITLVPLAQSAGAPLVEGASAGLFNLSTNPNDENAYIAEAVPEKIDLNYTTDEKSGEITVTNEDGSKDIYNGNGDLVRQTTREGITNPFSGINLSMYNVANKTKATPRPGTSTGSGISTTTGVGSGLLGSALLGSGVGALTDIGTGTGAGTTPTTTQPAAQPEWEIQHQTPNLVQGSAFRFGSAPTFSSTTNATQQAAPFGYAPPTYNAANGGSIQSFSDGGQPSAEEADYQKWQEEQAKKEAQENKELRSPSGYQNFMGGQKGFQFVHTPHFVSALNQLEAPATVDRTAQILAASGMQPVKNFAAGEEVESPEAPIKPVRRRPLWQGEGLRPFGFFQSPQYQPKQFADGGEVEGHNPQFFSEGGLQSLQNTYVKGPGDGTSDSVPAMLANGEFVIPADVVSKLGNGSNDAGADALSQMLVSIRKHAQNHDPKKLPPKSKGALAYLLNAKRKVG